MGTCYSPRLYTDQGRGQYDGQVVHWSLSTASESGVFNLFTGHLYSCLCNYNTTIY